MDIKVLKQLRDQTGAGVVAVKKALEEAKGDLTKAKAILRQKGLAKAKKKADRTTAEGQIYAYIHAGGQAGAMVELACETDFVARNNDFMTLCKEVAMQVVSMQPKNVKELLKQSYIREPEKTMVDLINNAIAKLGENIVVKRFKRFELGGK